MRIKRKREAGEILGRGGISERIIQIATEISQGTYKEAIEKAGQIHVLVDAASFDTYWQEKALIGMYREADILSLLIDGVFKREKIICEVNPYKKTEDSG